MTSMAVANAPGVSAVADLHTNSTVRAPTHRANAVLFDLDGTFLDTAPDLIGSLNDLRLEQGLPTLAATPLRPVVSQGSAALISRGFAMSPADPGFESLFQRYLNIYRGRLSQQTLPFPGIDKLLTQIEARNLHWGVVTNKPSWLTRPLLKQLGYAQRAACIISGDCRALHKPNPYPILEACRQMALEPADCIMVGDAQRDIVAARRAGALTLGALFGYLEPDTRIADWGANGFIEHPLEIVPWLIATANPASEHNSPGIGAASRAPPSYPG